MPARPPRLRRLAAWALALGAAPLAGCDDGIAPVPDAGAAVTLWGALDPTADTQAVRVVPVSPTLDPFTADPLDVSVTSTDLASGAVVPWRDSLVDFGANRFGHVFTAPFRPAFGGTYWLDVTPAGDDRAARAVVRVPPQIEPVRRPTRFGAGGPFEPVFWPGAAQLNAPLVTFLLEDSGCNRAPLTLPFEGAAGPTEFGWETTLSLSADAQRVFGALGSSAYALVEVTLSAEVASEDWRPRGAAFDPDLLIEPEGFSNVEGGFGFVGGAYRRALAWAPEGPTAIQAGFRPIGSCSP